jgi:hypothetical protein
LSVRGSAGSWWDCVLSMAYICVFSDWGMMSLYIETIEMIMLIVHYLVVSPCLVEAPLESVSECNDNYFPKVSFSSIFMALLLSSSDNHHG